MAVAARCWSILRRRAPQASPAAERPARAVMKWMRAFIDPRGSAPSVDGDCRTCAGGGPPLPMPSMRAVVTRLRELDRAHLAVGEYRPVHGVTRMAPHLMYPGARQPARAAGRRRRRPRGCSSRASSRSAGGDVALTVPAQRPSRPRWAG